MPKHIWSVICRKGSIDSETNLISLLDVLERIDVAIEKTEGVSELPKSGGILLPFEAELVSFFTCDPREESEVITEFLNPNGQILLAETHKLKVKAGDKRVRSKLKLSNLPVNKSGAYIFKVSIKDTSSNKALIVAEIPLDIEIIFK